MCFAPQRRALFRHRNFQKWSEPLVFLTFWLRNVLRATTACTFSTSQLPKVVRQWCVLYILTWKCASRHNGVQFFISHLASWLRTRRFSEPTFRPSGATNHWKNTVNRDFPTFSRICIFCLLTLSLLIFSLIMQYNRRKFRSQTSDNMERWKAEQGRGREKRKIRREKIRRERVRRQKIQMREKVGKSRNTLCFSNDLWLRRVEK